MQIHHHACRPAPRRSASISVHCVPTPFSGSSFLSFLYLFVDKNPRPASVIKRTKENHCVSFLVLLLKVHVFRMTTKHPWIEGRWVSAFLSMRSIMRKSRFPSLPALTCRVIDSVTSVGKKTHQIGQEARERGIEKIKKKCDLRPYLCHLQIRVKFCS